MENELRNHSTIIENLIKAGDSVVHDPNSSDLKTKACEQLRSALRSLREASNVRKKTLQQELEAFQVGTGFISYYSFHTKQANQSMILVLVKSKNIFFWASSENGKV